MIKNNKNTNITQETSLRKQKLLTLMLFFGIKSINLFSSFILYKAFGNIQFALEITFGVLIFTLLIILGKKYKLITIILNSSWLTVMLIGVITQSLFIPVLFFAIMLLYAYLNIYSKIDKQLNIKIGALGMNGILLNSIWIFLGAIVFYYYFGFLSLYIILFIDAIAVLINYGWKISTEKSQQSNSKIEIIPLMIGIGLLCIGALMILTIPTLKGIQDLITTFMSGGILLFCMGNYLIYCEFLKIIRKYI